MQYVIGAVVLVVVLFAFLQSGQNRYRKPRRVSVEVINDSLNRAQGALMADKLQDAEYHFTVAENYARVSGYAVLLAESYYGLAKVRESQKVYREAVHMIDRAIRALEPVRADFGSYRSMLMRYKEELSAKCS